MKIASLLPIVVLTQEGSLKDGARDFRLRVTNVGLGPALQVGYQLRSSQEGSEEEFTNYKAENFALGVAPDNYVVLGAEDIGHEHIAKFLRDGSMRFVARYRNAHGKPYYTEIRRDTIRTLGLSEQQWEVWPEI